MSRIAWSAVFLFTASCNAIVNFGELERIPTTGEEEPGPTEDAGKTESGTGTKQDSGPSKPVPCDPTKPFATPVLVPGPVNAVSAFENAPTLTDDELVMIFARLLGATDTALVMATRASVADDFGEPRSVPGFAPSGTPQGPTMTGDGLTLVWSDQTVSGGNITSARLMLARRGNTGDPFGTPAPFRPNAGTQIRMSPFVTRDGNELFFSQLEGQDIIHIYRSVLGDDLVYGVPERVDELASPDGSEGGIAMSNDGLTMYFASSRAGGQGPNDMYMATRIDRSSPWTNIARVPELSSASSDRPGFLSPDGCRLYLGSERETGGGLFVATKPPK